MTMTSRELVKRTLEFDGPARVPRDAWISPWAVLNYPDESRQIAEDFPSDFTGVPADAAFPLVSRIVHHAYTPHGAAFRVGSFTDEWGCTADNRQAGVWGEVKDPLVKNWSDVDKVRIPEEYLHVDVDAVNAFCRQTDKFVLGPSSFAPLPRIFERLQFLRGTENLYMDLLEQRDEFLALLHRVHQYYVDVLELWAKTNVDALWAMDDWGSQQALLIAPDLWRAVLKPLYAEYASIARDNGKHFLFHSDGYIMDVYPDVIEMGFSAINSQIFCMGVENVGKQFRGELTFWGEIDRQHILPDGTREDVAKAVHTVQDYLWRDGGVIAQCEFTAGAKPENVYQVFKTWNEYRFDA